MGAENALSFEYNKQELHVFHYKMNLVRWFVHCALECLFGVSRTSCKNARNGTAPHNDQPVPITLL